jgi:formylglycine-generating enzyme required for sulfatase activity
MKRIIPFSLVVVLLIFSGCFWSREKLSSGTTSVRQTDGMIMVYIPSGKFRMGNTEDDIDSAFDLCTHYWDHCEIDRFYDEMPQHTVVLDNLWMDQTEVTNEQYRKCVKADICEESRCWAGSQFNGLDQPIVCVTWHQAQTYCEWVGGRLPTEAEWEYAARGTTGFQYPWDNVFDGARLNYCDATCGRPRSEQAYNDGQLYSAPVGNYPDGVSWCGVLDMAGNVSEWVADWYKVYDQKEEINPLGPETGYSKVIRGGSWFLTRVETRSTWRDGISPDYWFDDLGFRCVIPEHLIEK